MKRYEVVTPLQREAGKKPVQPGKIVQLDAEEGDPLALLGALRALSGEPEAQDLPTDAADDAGDDDLTEMTVAQLGELAGREGVSDVPERAKKSMIIAAIVAHREKRAAEAADGVGQG